MSTNPNPSRITAASWWFMEQLLKLESDTENSGIYGPKPGYHGTRNENRARNGWDDYSVRALLDRLGPDDKAAAYDWTFHSAQRGDYSRMALFGARLLAAFTARDPRLAGWREALGQTDKDRAAEGLDFQGWFTRVPDSTHEWHFHFSEVRAYVESLVNKEAFLSVLAGETLAAYLARGGQLIGDDMPTANEIAAALLSARLTNGYTVNNALSTLLARTPVDLVARLNELLTAARDAKNTDVVLSDEALAEIESIKAAIEALNDPTAEQIADAVLDEDHARSAA